MQKKLTAWVTLLIVLLFLSLGSAFSAATRMDRAFAAVVPRYPSINSALIAIKFWNGVSVCVSIYTALLLYRMRPATLHWVKTGLVARFLCIACGSFSFPLLAGMSEEATASLFRNATDNVVASLIFTSAWFLYLTRSVKVREIYS